MWLLYFKEKFLSPAHHVVERSHTLISSPKRSSSVQMTKIQKAPLTNYEKWWPSEPEQDFIPQSSGVLVNAEKPTQNGGRDFFFSVVFADVSGINAMAHFKLPAWSQPAHKIPESLTTGSDLTRAHHWNSSVRPQQSAFLWLAGCARVHGGPAHHGRYQASSR